MKKYLTALLASLCAFFFKTPREDGLDADGLDLAYSDQYSEKEREEERVQKLARLTP